MIHDDNSTIGKSLRRQIEMDGRERHKMELKNILSSHESQDISIASYFLNEINQAAFSQKTMLNNGDLPISQNTVDDFLDSDE